LKRLLRIGGLEWSPRPPNYSALLFVLCQRRFGEVVAWKRHLAFLRRRGFRVVHPHARQGGQPFTIWRLAAHNLFQSHLFLEHHMPTNLLHELCNMGERCDAIAHVLQHERDANLHRCYVACREFSLALGHALTALADKTREQIESIG
jgi:hypothetical protein